MDLYAINYLHTGQPKQWYSVDLDSNPEFGKQFNLREVHIKEVFESKLSLSIISET